MRAPRRFIRFQKRYGNAHFNLERGGLQPQHVCIDHALYLSRAAARALHTAAVRTNSEGPLWGFSRVIALPICCGWGQPRSAK